ncbi:MAG: hypothetical protein K2Y32_00340 [Candidatus Obscuribacterales bacterium]|nr:hypothetical protein [Candidatus Obscuribacterales bacterium]
MAQDQIKFDIDESQIKVNPLVDGALRKQVQKLEEFVNKFDGNKNGIPDLQEYGALVQEGLPLLAELSSVIDFEKAAECATQLPFVKDKAKLVSLLRSLGSIAEKSGLALEAIKK